MILQSVMIAAFSAILLLPLQFIELSPVMHFTLTSVPIVATTSAVGVLLLSKLISSLRIEILSFDAMLKGLGRRTSFSASPRQPSCVGSLHASHCSGDVSAENSDFKRRTSVKQLPSVLRAPSSYSRAVDEEEEACVQCGTQGSMDSSSQVELHVSPCATPRAPQEPGSGVVTRC